MTISEKGLSDALADQEQTMPGFARWMYSSVRHYLGATVLDAGAGLGTYTELLLRDAKRVTSLEYDERFVAVLRERFAGDDRVKVLQGDLSDPRVFKDVPTVDSILCLNVLEHVEDDLSAMKNLYEKVRPGGTLAALVPAYPRLFNKMDVAVGHHRRYRKSEFEARLRTAGWTVERVFRFNAFGIAGWFVAGSILKRTTPGRDLTRLFDALVPAFSIFERGVIRGLVGLSLVAVCRRTS
jgi:SAM-dependent methyltransferase